MNLLDLGRGTNMRRKERAALEILEVELNLLRMAIQEGDPPREIRVRIDDILCGVGQLIAGKRSR